MRLKMMQRSMQMEESVWPQWKTTSDSCKILYITMNTKAEFNNNCFIIHSKYF